MCSAQGEVRKFCAFDFLLPYFLKLLWMCCKLGASLYVLFFYLNCEEVACLELQPSECTMLRLALLLLFYVVYGREL